MGPEDKLQMSDKADLRRIPIFKNLSDGEIEKIDEEMRKRTNMTAYQAISLEMLSFYRCSIPLDENYQFGKIGEKNTGKGENDTLKDLRTMESGLRNIAETNTYIMGALAVLPPPTANGFSQFGRDIANGRLNPFSRDGMDIYGPSYPQDTSKGHGAIKDGLEITFYQNLPWFFIDTFSATEDIVTVSNLSNFIKKLEEIKNMPLARIDGMIAELKKELKAARGNKDEIEKINQRIEELKGTREKLEKEIKDKEKSGLSQNEIQRIEDELKDLRTMIAKLDDEGNRLLERFNNNEDVDNDIINLLRQLDPESVSANKQLREFLQSVGMDVEGYARLKPDVEDDTKRRFIDAINLENFPNKKDFITICIKEKMLKLINRKTYIEAYKDFNTTNNLQKESNEKWWDRLYHLVASGIKWFGRAIMVVPGIKAIIFIWKQKREPINARFAQGLVPMFFGSLLLLGHDIYKGGKRLYIDGTETDVKEKMLETLLTDNEGFNKNENAFMINNTDEEIMKRYMGGSRGLNHDDKNVIDKLLLMRSNGDIVKNINDLAVLNKTQEQALDAVGESVLDNSQITTLQNLMKKLLNVDNLTTVTDIKQIKADLKSNITKVLRIKLDKTYVDGELDHVDQGKVDRLTNSLVELLQILKSGIGNNEAERQNAIKTKVKVNYNKEIQRQISKYDTNFDVPFVYWKRGKARAVKLLTLDKISGRSKADRGYENSKVYEQNFSVFVKSAAQSIYPGAENYDQLFEAARKELKIDTDLSKSTDSRAKIRFETIQNIIKELINLDPERKYLTEGDKYIKILQGKMVINPDVIANGATTAQINHHIEGLLENERRIVKCYTWLQRYCEKPAEIIERVAKAIVKDPLERDKDITAIINDLC